MKPAIEEWLDILRIKVAKEAPELLQLFKVYAGEARFGRSYIDPNLQKLTFDAQILEVGAGAMILASQLAREGYRVTALEPIGIGFSHFSQLRALILEQAKDEKCMPLLLEIQAESLESDNRFDFAFSINVMEHVGNVATVIDKVVKSLTSKGIYRFTCPNYLFPYEPHFNIPTLISRTLTEKVLRKRIVECDGMLDPVGVWNSLNWITVPMLKRICQSLGFICVYFDKNMLSIMLSRVVSDPEFSARRSPLLRLLLTFVVKLRLHKLTLLFPAVLHPVIDCTLRKKLVI